MSDQHPLSTVPGLIDAFGGATAFAAVIGKIPSTASEMKRRGSIPVDYWPTLVAASTGRPFGPLTYEHLVGMHLKHSGQHLPSRDLDQDCACPPNRSGCASATCLRAHQEVAA